MMWKKINIISGTTKEIYFVFVAFIPFLFLGFSRAYLAFFFHQLDSVESVIHLDNEQKPLIAAFITLLCPLGCIFTGICMDAIGRRYSLTLIYVPIIVAWALMGINRYIGYSVVIFYVAFLIQGIATGMSFCVGNYISEISIAKHRGSLFALLIINYNLGVVLSNCLMYVLPWNVVAFVFVGVAVSASIFTYFLPESPVWFYTKGRKECAIKTLSYIRSEPADRLESEIQDMEKYSSTKEKISLKKTIENVVAAWRQLIILILWFVIGCSTGFGIFPVYGIIILDSLNLPFVSSQVLVIYSICGIMACFFAPYFIHKFNRRSVLGVTVFMMGTSLVIIYFYSTFIHDSNQDYVWIVPVCLFLYSMVQNVGIVPLSFILAGELFPNESRGVLSGIQGSVGYLYWSALQKFFPDFLSAFGVATSLLSFSLGCFVTILFVIFILPETKGKTLNQIQDQYFPKKNNIKKSKSEVFTVPVS